MNESHQQSSHKTWRTSVKTQKTNLKSKKNGRAVEFSARNNFGEDENGEGEEKREGEKKNAEIWSHFSLLEGYITKIKKSKDILTLLILVI